MLVRPLLEWFEVTSSSKKLVVLLVMLGTVAVLMYGMVLGPHLNQVLALEHEVQLLDQGLKMQNSFGQQHQQLTTEVLALRDRYQGLSEALGLSLAATEVLSGISHAANQVGVSLTFWKPEPAPPVAGHDIYEMATRLEVEGNYQGLARFLDELARLPKALTVNAFSISAVPRDQGYKTIQVTLNLFGYESSGMLSLASSQTRPPVRLPIGASD
ncbi:MAG: type 4a pilus biogenesis protein PilO [Nitrospirota bacterium]|nr:type 4a pilus biogenesis protein PilO [Nitrospirota bacterium]